jgi:hypothetical protein
MQRRLALVDPARIEAVNDQTPESTASFAARRR